MKQNLSNDLRRNIFVNRADGRDRMGATGTSGEQPDSTDSIDNGTLANVAQLLGDLIGGPNRRRAGIKVNNVFFSLESILLTALLVVAIVALKRR